MKARFATACLAFHVAASLANAEWRELKNEAGCVVEIVADFSIEDLHVDAGGTASFTAKAMVAGEEVGFSASLSKAREGTIGVMFQKKELPVMRTDIDVRSIGTATERLERRLNTELGVLRASDGATHVIGLYEGISPHMAAPIAGIELIHGNGVGITYDERGNRVSGQCFALQLIVDGPLGRVTVYFHQEAGYGGTAAADLARGQWYQSRQKKEANHAPQSTIPTVTPPAGQEARQP